ncbi:MAG: circularly permuted type 2 ATP-grasp protein [Candidatus Eremiobacteraeota bacterium]|nr:circularly permuted type 2 ATP-grasp protein [Candidatus Eremiobacteraeota bacterium]
MLDLQPHYAVAENYDELYAQGGTPRPQYEALAATLAGLERGEILARVRAINTALLQRGVTFTVYADAAGTERVFPFDVIPRILTAQEWSRIERGIAQRVRAINSFIYDVYHSERILREKRIPRELVYSSKNYNREMIDVDVPHDVYIHVSGIDLIRDERGEFLVLEDNCRTPSGISYVLENRDVLKRGFSDLFRDYAVCPVDDYPNRLLDVLRYVAPRGNTQPNVVVLTPGIYNSAYFEHTLLARRMGAELVEGRDLIVVDNVVFLKTTRGLERIDVIYRRIDDDYLDPLYFLPDSALGVTGLMNAYRAGNVTIANAIGTGVGDDKAVYRYVPEMIRFYLDEEPLLANVPTFDCTDETQRRHVVSNLDSLVVKNTNASGGYGMLMGPYASSDERDRFKDLVEANPRDFIAQPVVQISSSPTLVEGEMVARRVDLRPFALYGRGVDVPPAALTRVALREGSLVVNSSQGGGSKDTWVLQG